MPTFTIDLNSLSAENVVPKADTVTFTSTVQVQLNFGGEGRRGTPFSDGIDSFSVGPGSTEKEFKSDASGHYGFDASTANGPSATSDIDVVSAR